MASAIAGPSLLYPPNPALMAYENAPKGGILINATRATSPRLGTFQLQGQDPRQHSPVGSNFTRTDSSSSSETGGHSRSNSVARKIRFAPLPDPRRAVLVTPDGTIIDSPIQLSPFPEESSFPVIPDCLTPCASTTGGAQNKAPSIRDDNTNTDTGSDANTAQSSPLTSKKEKRKSWSRRLFQPLLKSTSADGAAGEDPIWRTASRESQLSTRSNTTATDSEALPRRLTAPPMEKRPRRPRSAGAAPLTPVQSAGIAPGRNKPLLNGRTYGTRPSSAGNNAVEEPAFIEWGHGGAGSVNSGVSSRYAKVQSGGRLSIGAISGDAQPQADEDDGSGMAWVKKRREQRQKEKAEREAREQKEAEEKGDQVSSPSSPASSSPANVNSEPSSQRDLNKSADAPEKNTNLPSPGPTNGATTSAQPPSSAQSTPLEKDASLEQHVVTAVTVPMPPSHSHSHMHRTHSSHHSSLSNSATTLKPSERGISTPQSEPMHSLNATGSSTSAGSGGANGSTIVKVPEITQTSATSSENSSKSSSSSSSDDEEDEDDDNREDDDSETTDAEDEEEEKEQRKTSFCAGVEKVSRHKDQQ